MNKKLPYALAICLVVLLGVAGLFYYYTRYDKGVVLGDTKLTGMLYLTLNPTADISSINIYRFNLSNQSLTPLFNNNRLNFTLAFSADGTKMAYASEGTGEAAYQIYGETTDQQHFFQLTQDGNHYKREPVWSSDGTHVAYSVQPVVGIPPTASSTSGQASSSQASNPLLYPNSWVVFITDLNGQAKLVGAGADAFFSPDGKTLYALQNDGIHGVSVADIYAASAKKPATFGPLIVPASMGMAPAGSPQATSTALKSMKISISPDGKQLAWSVPTRGFVRIFNIVSWDPLALVAEKDIPTTALFSAFSPDSKYLALEQVTLDKSSLLFVDPSIVIYRLSDDTSVRALDLSAYTVTYLWLSAWR